jgi:hypothetical protein
VTREPPHEAVGAAAGFNDDLARHLPDVLGQDVGLRQLSCRDDHGEARCAIVHLAHDLPVITREDAVHRNDNVPHLHTAASCRTSSDQRGHHDPDPCCVGHQRDARPLALRQVDVDDLGRVCQGKGDARLG